MITLPCLPLIKERFINACKGQNYRVFPNDLHVYMFPQTWGDTSLGFGGMGGQAITTALTTIIGDNQNNVWGVFYDERLAYIVTDPTPEFWEDVRNWNIASVRNAHTRYVREENDNEQTGTSIQSNDDSNEK